MMNISVEEQASIKSRSAKPMLYLAIVSMCMIFGGLTSAYLVRSGDPGWILFELPQLFFISTVIIMVSSLSLIWAVQSARKDNYTGVKIGMTLTLILGMSFVVCQIKAWGAMVDMGIFIHSNNAAGQFLYIISFAHLLHLIAGVIMLIFVCIKSYKQIYHSKNLLGLQLCSIYWHFLDLLWVYLFLFMYFTH